MEYLPSYLQDTVSQLFAFYSDRRAGLSHAGVETFVEDCSLLRHGLRPRDVEDVFNFLTAAKDGADRCIETSDTFCRLLLGFTAVLYQCDGQVTEEDILDFLTTIVLVPRMAGVKWSRREEIASIGAASPGILIDVVVNTDAMLAAMSEREEEILKVFARLAWRETVGTDGTLAKEIMMDDQQNVVLALDLLLMFAMECELCPTPLSSTDVYKIALGVCLEEIRHSFSHEVGYKQRVDGVTDSQFLTVCALMATYNAAAKGSDGRRGGAESLVVDQCAGALHDLVDRMNIAYGILADEVGAVTDDRDDDEDGEAYPVDVLERVFEYYCGLESRDSVDEMCNRALHLLFRDSGLFEEGTLTPAELDIIWSRQLGNPGGGSRYLGLKLTFSQFRELLKEVAYRVMNGERKNNVKPTCMLKTTKVFQSYPYNDVDTNTLVNRYLVQLIHRVPAAPPGLLESPEVKVVMAEYEPQLRRIFKHYSNMTQQHKAAVANPEYNAHLHEALSLDGLLRMCEEFEIVPLLASKKRVVDIFKDVLRRCGVGGQGARRHVTYEGFVDELMSLAMTVILPPTDEGTSRNEGLSKTECVRAFLVRICSCKRYLELKRSAFLDPNGCVHGDTADVICSCFTKRPHVGDSEMPAGLPSSRTDSDHPNHDSCEPSVPPSQGPSRPFQRPPQVATSAHEANTSTIMNETTRTWTTNDDSVSEICTDIETTTTSIHGDGTSTARRSREKRLQRYEKMSEVFSMKLQSVDVSRQTRFDRTEAPANEKENCNGETDDNVEERRGRGVPMSEIFTVTRTQKHVEEIPMDFLHKAGLNALVCPQTQREIRDDRIQRFNRRLELKVQGVMNGEVVQRVRGMPKPHARKGTLNMANPLGASKNDPKLRDTVTLALWTIEKARAAQTRKFNGK